MTRRLREMDTPNFVIFVSFVVNLNSFFIP